MRLRKQYKYDPTDFDIAIYKYFFYGAIFFVLLVLVRILEISLLRHNHIISTSVWKFIAAGVFYDLIYSFQVGGFFLIPYLVLYNISRKLGFVIMATGLYVVIAFSLLFALYFSQRSILVDFHIFDNNFISGIGPYINATLFIIGCIILLLLGLFFVWLVRKERLPRVVYFTVLIISIASLVFYFRLFPKPNSFYSEINYNITVNKPNYLIYSALSNRFSNSSSLYTYNFEVEADSTNFKEGRLNMVSTRYPFLRPKEHESVLESLIASPNKPPTIILIVVEHLSGAFSGEEALLASFTPFIDSMATSGVFWPDFLCNSLDAENSLGVLLSSYFPCRVSSNIEKAVSLPSILSRNNYPSYFYSNTRELPDIIKTHYQGVFSQTYSAATLDWSSGQGIDKYYSQVISRLEGLGTRPGFHLVYQAFEPKEKETEAFRRYVAGLRKTGISNLDKYASFESNLFQSDQGIRKFITQLKEYMLWNNAVVIITGANHATEVPLANRIRKYNVPFLIISPYVKKATRISSISTHLNVAPSIAAWMENTYHFQIPEQLTFLGSLLSGNLLSTSNRSVPCRGYSGQFQEYLYRDVYYSQGHIYKVKNKLRLREIDNPDLLQKTRSKLNEFTEARNYDCRQSAKLPASK